MALRKASAYSKHRKVVYSRKSSVRSKSYIKTVPPIKIVKFVMGDSPKFEAGRFNFVIYLISKEEVQIRDNALESARMIIHREIEDQLKGDYYFSVKAYPHHILRENKMLVGAGADRMQTGMSLSFGAPVGRAAYIREGDTIFIVALNNKESLPPIRDILKKAQSKLPCKTKIVVTEVKK